MVKSFKNIMISTLIVGGVITGAVASNAYAAGNTGDTEFYFTFPSDTTVTTFAKTEERSKQDYTSAYMKMTSLTDGANGYKAEVMDEYLNPFIKRFGYVYFNDNNEDIGQYIPNYAAEERGIPVKVRIKAICIPSSVYGGWGAAGVWSPDSV